MSRSRAIIHRWYPQEVHGGLYIELYLKLAYSAKCQFRVIGRYLFSSIYLTACHQNGCSKKLMTCHQNGCSKKLMTCHQNGCSKKLMTCHQNGCSKKLMMYYQFA